MSKILDIPFSKMPLPAILEKVKKSLDTGKKLQIITLNTEMIMEAQKDMEFRQVIQDAGLVVPDSVGVQVGWHYQLVKPKALSARVFTVLTSVFKGMTGFGLRDPLEIVPGADLTLYIAGLAEEFGYKVLLVGGEDGVAQLAANKLKQIFPKLTITSFSGGKFTEERNPLLIKSINSARSDIMFLALGAPKQEKWLGHNLPKLNVTVAIGVGGTFDFLSGRVQRAPKALRSLGMEWVYRAARQPWRVKRQLALLSFLKALAKRG